MDNRFKTKPIEVEAFCLGIQTPPHWFHSMVPGQIQLRVEIGLIEATFNDKRIGIGDWVVKDIIDGSVVLMTKAEFIDKYEPVKSSELYADQKQGLIFSRYQLNAEFLKGESNFFGNIDLDKWKRFSEGSGECYLIDKTFEPESCYCDNH